MKNKSSLWTKDFSILTLGSVVSMFGNALSGFAISLLVLDYTSSPAYYAIFIVVYTLPQALMPIISGALLDRFSRRKTIYTLDFLSAVIYGAAAFILRGGRFSFPLLAVLCFLVGSIHSIYMVAYQSFYPMLITEGNFSKAYSISSLLETLSAIMVPVSALAYNAVGISPLLGINAVCFFTAAVFETRITAREEYVEVSSLVDQGMLSDIKEGFKYLFTEKGLLSVAALFLFISMAGGASSVIALPWFKENHSEYTYMLVMGAGVVGRAAAGIRHYRKKIPAAKRYGVAFAAYLTSAFMEGTYLYAPVLVMLPMLLVNGFMGTTSYTIRVAATQSYVPDERKGRFNGAFNMISTVGSLGGEMIAGALISFLPMRPVLTGFMALVALMTFLIIGGGKRHVAPIYNRET